MIIDPNKQSFSENYKLMIGSIVPRPIALVSTVSSNGLKNLAPFSYFNGVCSYPPTIMFAPGRRGYDGLTKDTLNNIRETEDFTVSIVSEKIGKQMVACATDYPPDVDEFEISGLTPLPSEKVKAPRVAESKVSFECKLNQIVEIGDDSPGAGFLVIGTIVIFHIDDDVYRDGKIDIKTLKPLGRLAGNSYTRISEIFDIVRKVRPD
ncbi:MAG TPA: flavin reductase family protein [Candidatus Marinimicrobia bacterium]|jgi:flavin reductase (DIM6/NTAB) family NADH-FMN oxidoreductase RutF|nr:flavin reductase family protein [Candidatus Neomarinimicrobiota bacterium]MDP7121664.1 flavin reductase family protein [Candidatus Neomarinimicrobiota bacterium]MDP7483669.1 flavin reductase family protein [Candidatus Neomarinimicrobiota bacterium]MDP7528249.1 flavin reductase family protein [Candidatus Neomarinimicrobiota bacterium]MDP7715794.1 flavin reductase family protein [Candidatus Neomarinimicrobiota bacterium]|tara:strand:+ start:25 stop:645 length:621 start_codon:yes stop_codon:yes gene_type:complete